MTDERPDIEARDEAPQTGGEPESAAAPEPGSLEDGIVKMLSTIYDPEIPVNIYELGLIYNFDVGEDGEVRITMTLTSPHCPVAESMPGEVQSKVEAVEGVRNAVIDLVWDPPWTPEHMSEAAKLELGFI